MRDLAAKVLEASHTLYLVEEPMASTIYSAIQALLEHIKKNETAKDSYYDGLEHCGKRYDDMLVPGVADGFGVQLNDNVSLYDFIQEFRHRVSQRWPLHKLNRWLGYIQGCLIERGYTTVQAERDWTRALFRDLDFA